jgi:glycosyltransferase involved in cell wall biosynthesis
MSSRPSVSIILPVYNTGRYLADTLRALLSQECLTPADEILVVDNGSADDSVRIAQSFQGIRLLHQPKRGSYAARNLGISSSKGDIVVFLDSDCRPREGWLVALLESMGDSATQIVLGRLSYPKPSSPLRALAAYENQKTRWVLANGDPAYIYGYAGNIAVRRSIFDRFGQFEERLRGGDTLFVQQVVRALGAGVVRFNPQMDVDHLEITSVSEHYRKVAIYAGSNEGLAQKVAFKPLSNRQRLAVFASLARQRLLNPWQLGQLITLLVPGAFIYDRAKKKAQSREPATRENNA